MLLPIMLAVEPVSTKTDTGSPFMATSTWGLSSCSPDQLAGCIMLAIVKIYSSSESLTCCSLAVV